MSEKQISSTQNVVGVAQSRLVSPWRDVTSFSQNAKDRTPRTWNAKYGKFSLVLTRHMDYAPDQWTAYCHEVFTQRVMASKDVREAACQAKAILQAELETAISEILGANVKAHPRGQEKPENQTGCFPASDGASCSPVFF